MEQNTIAKVLKGIGIGVMVLGVLAGFSVMGSRYGTFLTGLPYWVAGFVSGMSMLGFAEIINLLEDSKQAQHLILNSLNQMKQANTATPSPPAQEEAVPAAAPTAPAPPPAAQEAPPAGAFWDCPKCGEKSGMDARFCWHCGTDRDGQQ